jgi:hypothetical protein
MFSRNASSSRAIPISTMIDLVRSKPASPIHWGKNQSGMQAREELQEPYLSDVKNLWSRAKEQSCEIAALMNSLGAHKQIVNRILEPFQIIKVVMTATELDNFFHLRAHPDAQPEIRALAEAMLDSLKREGQEPVRLRSCDWHVPYFENGYWKPEDASCPLDEALAISASCCAQVSYRKLDKSLEKAQDIYLRLVNTKPVHASPFEHQARPMGEECYNSDIKNWKNLGVTHMTEEGDLWSGNFRGWVQHRQLIDGHVFKGENK